MNKRSVISAILALLVPGGGHFYLGKRGRALAFFAIVLFMFLIGLWLHGKLYVWEAGKPLSLLATIGSMGVGLPYLIARLLGPFGDLGSITYEYGTAFSLTAGLMNLLLVLDAYDIAEGRKE
jgi:uncharacterized membrane protein